MLQATEFDLKTGISLTEYDSDVAAPGQRRPKVQVIEHSYLEQWFANHQLDSPPLFVAQFYPGVDVGDQTRLAQEGKVLFATNGAKGYFTDPATAALMSQGDLARGIEPLYAAGPDSAHNAVAYGSLLLSDGKASKQFSNATGLPLRILVVDDERRDVGGPLYHFETGERLPTESVEQLLDRMGDGTMLVSPLTIEALVTRQDVEQTIKTVWREASPVEVDALSAQYWSAQDENRADWEGPDFSRDRLETLQDEVKKTLNQRVMQFRAAIPDYPGIAKGTLTASPALEALGVDLVISSNDIKGDDGQFSRPGIHEVDRVWLNRKSDARHRTQVVGPQVKGTIPTATAIELNPKALGRLAALNQAAADPHQLAQAYVAAQQKQADDTEQTDEAQPDWLATVLAADPYGTLERFPSVASALERWVRGERVEIALYGNDIPSATAQPHAQLKPWEICHPKLPDGALVAYYRSPFPNAGAAALALNNRDVLKTADPDAYGKTGVAYLNPWTAKEIAITDFDGDANGFFVGFEDQTSQLARQLREQLAPLANDPPAVQYEAARATFAQWIEQQAINPEQSPLKPADYPKVVTSFVEQNAPENRPPAITKQAKIKHGWTPETERLDQAIWRAWEPTANNPIGRVANTGMVLQSFANECAYGDRDRTGLARQIVQAYRKLLIQVDQGRLELPSDDQLNAQGLPALNLRERLESIAKGAQGTEQTLTDIHDLLMDVANGPVALNLQTAVDIAKSSRGIDESLHQLARALQYKPHELRAARKDPQIYTQDRVFPVNTDEPTAWMVEAVNGAYEVTQLPRTGDKIAKTFGPLLQGEFEPEQAQQAQQLCDHYYGLVREQSQAERRLAAQSPRALAQPSLELTSASSGKTIQVERLIDGLAGADFDWRAAGKMDWRVVIRPDENSRFVVSQRQGSEEQRLGWVNPANAQTVGLAEALSGQSQLVLDQPEVRLRPPARLENDLDELRTKPQRYLESVAKDLKAEQRATLSAALWQTNIQRPGQTQARMGINLAMRMFPEQVAEQLKTGPPRLYFSRAPGVSLPDGAFTAQIQTVMEPNKSGQLVERRALVHQGDAGEPVRLGLLAETGIHLASNIEVKASLVETEVQSARMTMTTPEGEIQVTKVQQFDFAQATLRGQSAKLQLQNSPDGIHVQVLQPGETTQTLGLLENQTKVGRMAAQQLWQQQGDQPWVSTLSRGSYTKLELQVEGLAAEPESMVQPRSFEQALAAQQQAQQVSPSYSQLQQWWQVAHAQKQPALEAEVKQTGEQLVLAWQDQGNSDPPPLNFRSLDVVLAPQQAKQMKQALAWRQQRQPSYSPSYQELQSLWREAGQVGNRQFQEKVAQLGQQLVAAFEHEQGQPGKPGAEYRSGDVRLAVAEQRGMYGAPRQKSVGERRAGLGYE